MLLTAFLVFSSASANAQYYRKKGGKKGSGKNVDWKKNVLWLEGLGSNQVIGVKYERIMHFGPFFSVRFNGGITPFLLDEKYNFIVGRSITPITGMGLFLNFPPTPLHVGVGCDVLHDIFPGGIPEIQGDSSNTYSTSTYRARVMPWIVFEGTIKDRFAIRGGYSLIIDPANHFQTTTYITHWATIGFGYKFGN